MNINSIFENNKEWIARQLALDKDYFTHLAEGQSPEILYIGCSDSRVTAEELMGAEPGEIFVHRNIANLIPNTDLNSRSVIDYAVSHLKVKHVVVCGHYHCGGIKAAMENENLGILNPWLGNIRDVYRLHYKELNAIEDTDRRYERLVELNVAEQCLNVGKIPEVQDAIINRNLSIHGWVFDVRTGQLIDLTKEFANSFQIRAQKIADIYLFKPDTSG